MITRNEYEIILKEATEILTHVGIVVCQHEIKAMEVADLGLSEIRISGAQIITLVDTKQIGAKLLVMLPNQTMPEHTHPHLDGYQGKEETLRCEWGELYVYGPGERTLNPKGCPPEHRQHTYTMWHEYILSSGDQVTFLPNSPHWFQGGPEGCVFWSFSTKVLDHEDQFTDSEIQRKTVIVDE